jgi:riboflavin synthase
VFTGLVEEVGTVAGIYELGDSVQLLIAGKRVTADAHLGGSISVNGCCLTVTALGGDGDFAVDVMSESLDRTNLGDLGKGDPVNLERAMQVGARLGGHIVQGHVDGIGELLDRTPSEHSDLLRFGLSADLARYLVSKGSVTVNGVSLTVVDVVDGASPWFSVSLIPTTLSETNLGTLEPGDTVNLEVDVLAKYVERLFGAQQK